LANAKLPPPPEETTQLDVLLRPGLLADVEIIVEKIPSALHVPVQAVFQKEGKPVVYVQKGSNFEPRFIEIAKRSESTMVLKSGVKPDEVIALADPLARKGSKREEPKKGGSGNPMGGMPAGGGGK
jgi:multidrug efflux pump subunit AcrA (membrane-fusion protein)